MSFLPLKPRQKILLLFIRAQKPWYIKLFKGFNHVAIGWIVQNNWVFILEPQVSGAVVKFKDMPKTHEWDHFTVIELDLVNDMKRKLFKPTFTTCATIVQYLAGISLGARLAQTLYDQLTKRDKRYLLAHGIRRVTLWESKQP